MTAASAADVADLIERILADRAVFPLYQPIVDLADGRVVGAEALARGPAGSSVESPESLYAAAARVALLEPLDQVAFGRAVEVALRSPDPPPLLFVNAEPAAIGAPIDPALLALMREPKPFRVVMEFTERALGLHLERLLNLARRGWADGNALALDDVGADPMSLALLPLLAPEVIKLDQCFMRESVIDATNATISLVGAYAHDAGAVILAEGIETERDVERARSLGARWGQGWLFGRPAGLAAIAERRVNRSVTLRPPPCDATDPETSPFAILERAGSVRASGALAEDRLLDEVITVARRGGHLAVVIGCYHDEVTGRAWLGRLSPHSAALAHVGLSGPRPAGVDIGKVRLVIPSAGAARGEATLTVVCPGEAIAVGIRRRGDGGSDCVASRDTHLVHAVARVLLRAFE